MALNIGGGLSGAGTGATIGSAIPGIGTAAGAIAGGILGLFRGDSGKKDKKLMQQAWEYEKEWRLFSPPSIDSVTNHKVIFSLKPTAVYIGRRSSAEQAQILNEICKEKDIPCYQMIQNYPGSDFKLFPVPYEEYIKSGSPRN